MILTEQYRKHLEEIKKKKERDIVSPFVKEKKKEDKEVKLFKAKAEKKEKKEKYVFVEKWKTDQ